ncbi:collagen alpha-1(III) chain-like [Plodia interpunctella]|uniref:collagen alpha-1(III) chain-like n=1 Tax=Plodia interpunctella TaxID=58824 RepID=UPI002367D16B|nr:collagen alpha-1(I) chain-like [Plodia interpunctella]
MLWRGILILSTIDIITTTTILPKSRSAVYRDDYRNYKSPKRQLKESRLEWLYPPSNNMATLHSQAENKDLICGNDAKIYKNYREFMTAKLKQTDLQMVHSGSCPRASKQRTHIANKQKFIDFPLHRNMEVTSVCGNDIKTYNTYQQLEIMRLVQPNLKFLHPGPCFLESEGFKARSARRNTVLMNLNPRKRAVDKSDPKPQNSLSREDNHSLQLFKDAPEGETVGEAPDDGTSGTQTTGGDANSLEVAEESSLETQAKDKAPDSSETTGVDSPEGQGQEFSSPAALRDSPGAQGTNAVPSRPEGPRASSSERQDNGVSSSRPGAFEDSLPERQATGTVPDKFETPGGGSPVRQATDGTPSEPGSGFSESLGNGRAPSISEARGRGSHGRQGNVRAPSRLEAHDSSFPGRQGSILSRPQAPGSDFPERQANGVGYSGRPASGNNPGRSGAPRGDSGLPGAPGGVNLLRKPKTSTGSNPLWWWLLDAGKNPEGNGVGGREAGTGSSYGSGRPGRPQVSGGSGNILIRPSGGWPGHGGPPGAPDGGWGNGAGLPSRSYSGGNIPGRPGAPGGVWRESSPGAFGSSGEVWGREDANGVQESPGALGGGWGGEGLPTLLGSDSKSGQPGSTYTGWGGRGKIPIASGTESGSGGSLPGSQGSRGVGWGGNHDPQRIPEGNTIEVWDGGRGMPYGSGSLPGRPNHSAREDGSKTEWRESRLWADGIGGSQGAPNPSGRPIGKNGLSDSYSAPGEGGQGRPVPSPPSDIWKGKGLKKRKIIGRSSFTKKLGNFKEVAGDIYGFFKDAMGIIGYLSED